MLSRVALSLLGVCLLVVLVRTKTNFKRNNVQNLIERLAMEKQTISAKRQGDATVNGAMHDRMDGAMNGTDNGTMDGKGKKDCDCDDDDEYEPENEYEYDPMFPQYLAWWDAQLQLFGRQPPWFKFADYIAEST